MSVLCFGFFFPPLQHEMLMLQLTVLWDISQDRGYSGNSSLALCCDLKYAAITHVVPLPKLPGVWFELRMLLRLI